MTNPVLYDHPGPRARRRNVVLTVVFGLVLLGLAWYVIRRFVERDQFSAARWAPFGESRIWVDFILPGLWGTVSAAATAMVLSLAFGVVFAVLRLSPRWWLRAPAGAVVEFFRAVPLLLLIFFIFYGHSYLVDFTLTQFWALVFGLTLYNGSVLAEAFRAGILSVPRGQSEAGLAVGLRPDQVMRHILLPQATRAMLPVLVSQLVVLLKDTALGYLISYPELLEKGVNQVAPNFNNTVAAAMVVAVIFIVVNVGLTTLAGTLERLTRRRRSTTATALTGLGQG
jgi:glutamate transport system permease protein